VSSKRFRLGLLAEIIFDGDHALDCEQRSRAQSCELVSISPDRTRDRHSSSLYAANECCLEQTEKQFWIAPNCCVIYLDLYENPL
jgi:hypothetical protein